MIFSAFEIVNSQEYSESNIILNDDSKDQNQFRDFFHSQKEALEVILNQ